jgi:hypothetical protein
MAARRPVAAMVGLGALIAACAVAAAVVPRPSSSGPALPVSGPGTATVTLSPDARVHPEGESVRSLLQRHFDAINTRNYPGWAATVVPERVAMLPEPAFRKAYATTRDGNVRVDRIENSAPRPSGSHDLVVRFRFVSEQDPQDAPEQLRVGRICWASSLPLVGAPRRIGMTGGGSSLPQAC